MKYGQIRGLEPPVSRLVMGSMVCTTDEMDLTCALLDAFVAAGGNCIDSAHVYGGGKSERALGQWFAGRQNREKIVLLDKGAHPYWTEPRVNPECIRQDIMESLERLQSGYIDLYLLHRDDPTVPVGPIVESLNEEQAAGRIRAFGGSNWTTTRIQEANDYAAAHGLQPFVASSPHLSLAAINEVMWNGCLALDAAGKAWHTTHQFPLFPWSSQAGGFFAGRFAPEDLSNKDIVRVYYNEGNWERLRRARELAAQRGRTANQIALAWVLHQPFPVFALIGPRTLAELEDSLPALDIVLTPEEMRRLNLE
jgi:aryl-alcohol dehydrogenase-like predicted oxidoreductase